VLSEFNPLNLYVGEKKKKKKDSFGHFNQVSGDSRRSIPTNHAAERGSMQTRLRIDERERRRRRVLKMKREVHCVCVCGGGGGG